MSGLLGILASQAPPKQDATSTIQTLCLRLSTSTLLEDRRAAVLGLRSFARDYKELVASEGLRGLIAALARDREDPETVVAVLETLWGLFERTGEGESDDDIPLWLTDEFTQKQDNINLLVSLLEDVEFPIRLNTIKLLDVMADLRPSRTPQAILEAPLGLHRAIDCLADRREPIRNAALLFLIHIADGQTENQKALGALNTFEVVFEILEQEGGVEGGIVAQDCLALLSTLLGGNHMNQMMMRDTGFGRFVRLLEVGSGEDLFPHEREQRDANIMWTLKVIRHFVVPGGVGTTENQTALAGLRYQNYEGELVPQVGEQCVLTRVLDIAFSPSFEWTVRAEALKTLADMIDAHPDLQVAFSRLAVGPEINDMSVLESLLGISLDEAPLGATDMRLAACRCLEAFLNENRQVRKFFLEKAIEKHADPEDDSPNIVTSLLHLDSAARSNPYRIWIANVVMIHLICADTEVKRNAQAITEGNADEGEEVVTAIQTIGENLRTALEHHYDSRIAIGYIMLLCVWFFEDSDAVDDFLNEAGFLTSLVNAVKDNTVDPIAQGLAACLLGIIYEFSHAESPLPRKTVHALLSTQLTRDLYVSKVTKLRSHPMIRDFDVPKEEFFDGGGGGVGRHLLPEVYFDKTFVDFFKESYSHILKALDKEPKFETRVDSTGEVKVTNGISVDKFASLQSEVASLTSSLEVSESARQHLESEIQSLSHELARSRESLAAASQSHSSNINILKSQHASALADANGKTRQLIEEITQRNAKKVAEKDAEIKQLQKRVEEAVKAVKAADAEKAGIKRQLEEKQRELEKVKRESEEKLKRLAATLQEREAGLTGLQKRLEEERIARQEDNRIADENWKRAEAVAREAIGEERARTVAEKKAAEEAVKRAEETARWETDAVRVELEEVKEALKKERLGQEEKIRSLKADHEKEIGEVKKKTDKVLGTIREHEQTVKSLNEQLAQAYERAERAEKAVVDAEDAAVEANGSLEEQLKALREEKTVVEKERDEARKKSEKAEQDAEAAAEKAAAEAKEKLERAEKEAAEAKAAAEKAQQEARTAAEKAAAEAKEKLEKAEKEAAEFKAAAEEARKEAQEAKSKSATKDDTESKKELADLKKKLEAAEARAKAAEEGAKKQLEDAKAKAAEELNRQVEAAKAEAEAEVKSAEEHAKAAEEVKKKLKAAEKEKAEAEEKAKAAQTELEDLFMVLADLEEKRQKDKNRLKEMGQEVSDDEDDDDDEDDE